MLDDPELVKHFPPLLKALKARLKSLPKSIPLGNVLLAGEASLVRYFGDLEVDEGPAFTVNRQWEHAFQVSEEEQRKRKPPMASPSKGIFRCAVAGGGSASSMRETAQTELQVYFSGIYPMADDDDGILGWWKLHAIHFPILSCIVRDILCIPGVSIVVERLFSSSKHMMSDARSSMAASTASSTVVTKELLNAGFGDKLDYLEGVTIH